MEITCDQCGKKYRLGDHVLEVVFSCTNCQHIVHARKSGYVSSSNDSSIPAGQKPVSEWRKKRPRSLKIMIFLGALLCILMIVLGYNFFVKGAFNTKEPILLGCPLSTSYLYGRTAERGIRLAVEEINEQGGVHIQGKKRPFEVIVMDTHDLEPGVPVSAALDVTERLITEKGVDFIMGGPVRSEAALAAMDILSRHKKISILSTGALTPKYHHLVEEAYDQYKYCFRVSGEAQWMVKEITSCLSYIKEHFNLNQIFLMLQDVSHSRGGGNIIEKIALESGWSVLGKEIYPTGSMDFSTGLLKVKESGAQVLLIWMDMPESSFLIQQWYDMKIPALPFGSIISVAETPDFLKTMEGKGEFCLANVVNAGNAPSKATPWTMKFYNAYMAKWGIEPEGYGASSSYMAAYVLKEAIERADSLEPDEVIKALEATDLMGVYGRIRFDGKSHQVIPSLDPRNGAVGTIFQWQGNQRVVVFPPSITEERIQLPPWMEK